MHCTKRSGRCARSVGGSKEQYSEMVQNEDSRLRGQYSGPMASIFGVCDCTYLCGDTHYKEPTRPTHPCGSLEKSTHGPSLSSFFAIREFQSTCRPCERAAVPKDFSIQVSFGFVVLVHKVSRVSLRWKSALKSVASVLNFKLAVHVPCGELDADLWG